MLSVPPITVKLVDSNGLMSTVWHSFFTSLRDTGDKANGIVISSVADVAGMFESKQGVVDDVTKLFGNNIGNVSTLSVVKNIYLVDTVHRNQYGIIYKEGVPFLHNFNFGDNGTVVTDGSNLFLGKSSGNFTMGSGATSIEQGCYNIGIGDFSLNKNALGSGNLAVGLLALTANTDGNDNVAIGNFSLYSNTTGFSNFAVGAYALFSNIIGYENMALGVCALYSNTGFANTGIGSYALFANTNGNYNTGIGSSALYSNTTGIANVGIGANALNYNTSGKNNIGIGSASLLCNVTGNYNMALGTSSAQENIDGNYNISIGEKALFNNLHGSNNIAIGALCLNFLNDGITKLTQGEGLIGIGNNITTLADNEVNEILIGNDVEGMGSNSAVIGNDDIVTTLLKGEVVVGKEKNVSLKYDGTDTELNTEKVAPSDFIVTCGANKTLKLTNVVYDDIQIQLGDIIGQSWFGAQWSDIVEYRTGVAIRLSDSTVNNFKFKFNSQLPHTYAEENDILFHLHIGNNSTTTGDVVLKFTWEWTNVDEAYGASTSETKTFTVTGTDGLHEVFEFSVPLSGAGKKISSILLCKVERLAADSADTFTEDLYVTAVDFHVPVNTNGSRQEWVK